MLMQQMEVWITSSDLTLINRVPLIATIEIFAIERGMRYSESLLFLVTIAIQSGISERADRKSKKLRIVSAYDRG